MGAGRYSGMTLVRLRGLHSRTPPCAPVVGPPSARVARATQRSHLVCRRAGLMQSGGAGSCCALHSCSSCSAGGDRQEPPAGSIGSSTGSLSRRERPARGGGGAGAARSAWLPWRSAHALRGRWAGLRSSPPEVELGAPARPPLVSGLSVPAVAKLLHLLCVTVAACDGPRT